MKILLTNDDGINAKGIRVLMQKLSEFHEVYAVAPDRERSGFSHSVTFKKEVVLTPVSGVKNAYFIDGTPCDCIKLAVDHLVYPDLIISGINPTRNLGTDVWYSGTTNAAMEGLICGVPSIAVSQNRDCGDDYEFSSDFVVKNVEKFHDFCKERNCVLNINVPDVKKKPCAGVKFVAIGRRSYRGDFSKVGENSYLLNGKPHDDDIDKECDLKYSAANYITISPIKLDCTDYEALKDGLL